MLEEKTVIEFENKESGIKTSVTVLAITVNPTTMMSLSSKYYAGKHTIEHVTNCTRTSRVRLTVKPNHGRKSRTDKRSYNRNAIPRLTPISPPLNIKFGGVSTEKSVSTKHGAPTNESQTTHQQHNHAP